MSSSNSARHLKDEATDRLSGDYESLKGDVSQLRNDVVDLLSHALGLGKSSASNIGSSVRGTAVDAMESLKEQISSLREQGNDKVAAVGKKIEDNPLASTAVAFGVGFILAKILSRK